MSAAPHRPVLAYYVLFNINIHDSYLLRNGSCGKRTFWLIGNRSNDIFPPPVMADILETSNSASERSCEIFLRVCP